VVYGSGTWVRMHDSWVLWEKHGMIRMLLTGRRDVAKRGRFWLGLTDEDVGLLGGVDCDILTQGLI
jgi:hypothetical protein